MLDAIEKIMLVVEPLGLAVLLIFTFGLFRRSVENTLVLNMIMGGLFGLAAAMAMLSPIPIADGVIVDVRNLFIGMAGAFFGLIGGGIALIIGIAARIAIGGDGVELGIAGMVVAVSLGVGWGRFVRPHIHHDLTAFLTLGAMISCHMVVAVLLPPALLTRFFLDLGPTLIAANLCGSVLLGQLITRENALIDEARRLASEATTDPLTKLINRSTAAAIFSDLPKPQNRQHGQTMLCIDVDEFKAINDQHGHVCGDHVLVEIANRLTHCVRPNDILSRISGDEFLIVLHDIHPDQARRVADRCLTTINEQAIVANGVAIDASISVGAVWTNSKPSFTAFRQSADNALYQAKSLGRDCVAFETNATFSPQMQARFA